MKIAKASDAATINTVQDVLDLLGNASYQGSDRIIVKETNLNAEFFNLSSGLAGEILQKISNYYKKLAIIGNFERYKSKALEAFIVECNRGDHIFFVPDLEAALVKLVRC